MTLMPRLGRGGFFGGLLFAVSIGCTESGPQVQSPVSRVVLTLDSVTMVPGGQLYRLSATVLDASNQSTLSYPVAWRSSDTTKAVVDALGTVMARSLGEALIVASVGGHADTVRITIVNVTFAQTSVGEGHSCGVTSQGIAFCWGAGRGDGVIGLPDAALITTGPVAVQGAPRLISVSVGWEHSCGLTASGKAWCWGANREGQLGLGMTDANPHGPTAVDGGLTYVSIDAGPYHTCGIVTGGAAYCWGYSSEGENGHGEQPGTIDSVPTAVAGGIAFLALASGQTHTCGIATDSAAYCWGDGHSLGASPIPPACVLTDPANPYCPVPVPVSGGLRFVAIDLGAQSTCALATTGAADCWGYNQVPSAVVGGHVFVSMATGKAHACGLESAGQAFCWGYGLDGELGDGSGASSSTPLAVSGSLAFAAIGLGVTASCGTTTSHVTYCWGANAYGTIGIGAYPEPAIVLVPNRVVGQP